MSKAMETAMTVIGGAVMVIVMIAVLGLLLALPIKWTWNVTMPYLFGFPVLTWGKAWCLNFLCGCLINRGKCSSSK